MWNVALCKRLDIYRKESMIVSVSHTSVIMVRNAVGAIIYNDENQYLLVHKIRRMEGGPVNMDSWDFVKGGVKKGESFLCAVIRELKEETGSEAYIIEKEYEDMIEFDFPYEVTKKNGYQSQQTKMYLVKYCGNYDDLNVDGKEISELSFFPEQHILTKLENPETEHFWMRYLGGSLK